MLKVASLIFNPFVNDSRVLKEALSLQTHDYDVTVIAHGDESLKDDEIVNGFKVKRLGYLNRKITKNKFAKLGAYLDYIKKAVSYSKEFDILHCNDLNTLPIAVIIKKYFNKNVKIMYDAHEYETEMKGMQGTQKYLIKWLERDFIKYADKVITVSDSIANEYARLYDIPKPELVLNAPPYRKIVKKDIFRDTLGIVKDQTIFLYQGGLSPGRGIEILLEAFKDSEHNSVIVFMGSGPLEHVVKEHVKNYNTIFFHEAVSHDVLLDYTCSADYGILFYENNCLNHYYCSPNKMFEYLMAEIPVIASNLFEMKRLIQENTIGVVARENSPDGLREAIKEAVMIDKSLLGNNIKKVKEMYNWEEQEKVLLEVYSELSK